MTACGEVSALSAKGAPAGPVAVLSDGFKAEGVAVEVWEWKCRWTAGWSHSHGDVPVLLEDHKRAVKSSICLNTPAAKANQSTVGDPCWAASKNPAMMASGMPCGPPLVSATNPGRSRSMPSPVVPMWTSHAKWDSGNLRFPEDTDY